MTTSIKVEKIRVDNTKRNLPSYNRYVVTSGNKEAAISNFGTYWHLVYTKNNACKNFKTYHDAIKHLIKKGW